MTFLMLTTILTCAMVFCPLESAQAAELKPCHQSEEAQKDGQKTDPMFALDCMGVDLFQQDVQADVMQPDQSLDQIYFAWADLISNYNALIGNSHFIRGPPFDASPLHINDHDLYLTTQRLRI
ncbi:MAG: hypothetical protein CO093_02060 [Alphaproteobacteria bacterium CG_4_9_14_3_um_filter_47_13]|nr:MAG: hypothetical protein CO093_02060 [Alphaproteobacteria bacterium CG_4_9_14_3_um_filter_47_13]